MVRQKYFWQQTEKKSLGNAKVSAQRPWGLSATYYVANIDRSVYTVPDLDAQIRALEIANTGEEAPWYIENRMKANETMQAADLGSGCILDWELLSECGCFVGDLERQFFRAAVYLNIAKTGSVPPLLSISAFPDAEYTFV